MNDRKLVIKREWCKGCGICIAFCPENVLALDDEGRVFLLNPADCIFCSMCELRCPDMAISIIDKRGAPDE